MKAIQHFDAIWQRCDEISVLQAYLAAHVSAALNPDELLRAEWVARLSALDLYVHERVAQAMVEIFEGVRPPTDAYQRFKISLDTLNRIRSASTHSEATAAFDLEMRNQLSLVTYQDPEKIADGMRLFSTVELWNELALKLGANEANKVEEAKKIKTELSLMVRRRNRIAHEGDLQPAAVRIPWPITQSDVALVRTLIEKLVRAIDSLV